MKDAIRAALLGSPLSWAALCIMGSLLVIVAVLSLAIKALNMDDIRAELKAATAQRERIEGHLKVIDRQNAESRKDRARLNETVKKIAEPESE